MMELMDLAERDRLTADLRSGQADRVAGALETLDQAWRRRRFRPLPLPEPDSLDAFGGSVPVETLARYLSVIQNYPDFEPTPSVSDLRHALVEAVIRYGRGEKTSDVALHLGIDQFPEAAVYDALGYLRDRGLNGPEETLAAQRLVEYLLDSQGTRRATVDMLRSCAMMGCLHEVIDQVWSRLNDVERLRVKVDSAD